MVLQFGVVAADLTSERAGAEIACRADFEMHPLLAQRGGQFGIAGSCDAMADAFSAEKRERVADRIRAADFTGVGHARECAGGREVEHNKRVW